jgi:6-pyruvoyltetrahydropterin/6-carboxytetrahydropterin synthase
MCRHGGSRIVNVSSLAQLDPLPGFFAYASSKSALHLLTVVANAEGEPHDIRAFTVAPGVVDTPLHRTLVPGGLPPVDGQSSVLQADDVARVILEIAEGKHDRRAGWVLAIPAPAAVSSLTQWVADHPGGGAEIVEATRNSEFLGSALTAHEPSVSPTPPPRVAILRHEHFNSAHRIHNPALSDADNKRIYGKCNNPNYHGHNYEIAVRVAGPVDPVIGYVMDLGELSSAIRQHVLERLDHMNLNLDVPEFRDVNPTAENIAVVIYGLLRPHVPQRLDLHVTLCETPRNIVQYPADIVVAP